MSVLLRALVGPILFKRSLQIVLCAFFTVSAHSDWSLEAIPVGSIEEIGQQKHLIDIVQNSLKMIYHTVGCSDAEYKKLIAEPITYLLDIQENLTDFKKPQNDVYAAGQVWATLPAYCKAHKQDARGICYRGMDSKNLHFQKYWTFLDLFSQMNGEDIASNKTTPEFQTKIWASIDEIRRSSLNIRDRIGGRENSGNNKAYSCQKGALFDNLRSNIEAAYQKISEGTKKERNIPVIYRGSESTDSSDQNDENSKEEEEEEEEEKKDEEPSNTDQVNTHGTPETHAEELDKHKLNLKSDIAPTVHLLVNLLGIPEEDRSQINPHDESPYTFSYYAYCPLQKIAHWIGDDLKTLANTEDEINSSTLSEVRSLLEHELRNRKANKILRNSDVNLLVNSAFKALSSLETKDPDCKNFNVDAISDPITQFALWGEDYFSFVPNSYKRDAVALYANDNENENSEDSVLDFSDPYEKHIELALRATEVAFPAHQSLEVPDWYLNARKENITHAHGPFSANPRNLSFERVAMGEHVGSDEKVGIDMIRMSWFDENPKHPDARFDLFVPDTGCPKFFNEILTCAHRNNNSRVLTEILALVAGHSFGPQGIRSPSWLHQASEGGATAEVATAVMAKLSVCFPYNPQNNTGINWNRVASNRFIGPVSDTKGDEITPPIVDGDLSRHGIPGVENHIFPGEDKGSGAARNDQAIKAAVYAAANRGHLNPTCTGHDCDADHLTEDSVSASHLDTRTEQKGLGTLLKIGRAQKARQGPLKNFLNKIAPWKSPAPTESTVLPSNSTFVSFHTNAGGYSEKKAATHYGYPNIVPLKYPGELADERARLASIMFGGLSRAHIEQTPEDDPFTKLYNSNPQGARKRYIKVLGNNPDNFANTVRGRAAVFLESYFGDGKFGILKSDERKRSNALPMVGVWTRPEKDNNGQYQSIKMPLIPEKVSSNAIIRKISKYTEVHDNYVKHITGALACAMMCNEVDPSSNITKEKLEAAQKTCFEKYQHHNPIHERVNTNDLAASADEDAEKKSKSGLHKIVSSTAEQIITTDDEYTYFFWDRSQKGTEPFGKLINTLKFGSSAGKSIYGRPKVLAEHNALMVTRIAHNGSHYIEFYDLSSPTLSRIALGDHVGWPYAPIYGPLNENAPTSIFSSNYNLATDRLSLNTHIEKPGSSVEKMETTVIDTALPEAITQRAPVQNSVSNERMSVTNSFGNLPNAPRYLTPNVPTQTEQKQALHTERRSLLPANAEEIVGLSENTAGYAGVESYFYIQFLDENLESTPNHYLYDYNPGTKRIEEQSLDMSSELGNTVQMAADPSMEGFMLLTVHGAENARKREFVYFQDRESAGKTLSLEFPSTVNTKKLEKNMYVSSFKLLPKKANTPEGQYELMLYYTDGKGNHEVVNVTTQIK